MAEQSSREIRYNCRFSGVTEAEERSLQSSAEEAVGRLIAERRGLDPVVAERDALRESMARYEAVYRRLAE